MGNSQRHRRDSEVQAQRQGLKEVTSKTTLDKEQESAMKRREETRKENEEPRISGFKNSLCTSSEVKKKEPKI